MSIIHCSLDPNGQLSRGFPIVITHSLRICLLGDMKKWNDKKWRGDGKIERYKIFKFPLIVFGWEDGKV